MNVCDIKEISFDEANSNKNLIPNLNSSKTARFVQRRSQTTLGIHHREFLGFSPHTVEWDRDEKRQRHSYLSKVGMESISHSSRLAPLTGVLKNSILLYGVPSLSCTRRQGWGIPLVPTDLHSSGFIRHGYLSLAPGPSKRSLFYIQLQPDTNGTIPSGCVTLKFICCNVSTTRTRKVLR